MHDVSERLMEIMARRDAECKSVMTELSDDELATLAAASNKTGNGFRNQFPRFAFNALVERHEMAWLKLQQKRNPDMVIDFDLYEAIKTEFFETFKKEASYEGASYEGQCAESPGSVDSEGD